MHRILGIQIYQKKKFKSRLNVFIIYIYLLLKKRGFGHSNKLDICTLKLFDFLSLSRIGKVIIFRKNTKKI